MPPKKKSQKKPNVITPEEKRRREAQSKRDKALHSQKVNGATGKTRQKIAPGQLSKRVLPANAMSMIAQTVVAPRDLPPMRFPSQVHEWTDTKHIFQMNSAGKLYDKNETPAVGTTLVCTPTVMGSVLDDGAGFLVHTRNPVAPIFLTEPIPYGLYTTESVYNWNLAGDDAPLVAGARTDPLSLLIFNDVQVEPNSASAAMMYVYPSEERSIITPLFTSYASGPVVNGMGNPMYRDEYGRTWNFWGGGVMVLKFTSLQALAATTAAVPTGGGIIVSVTLEKYTGGREIDEKGRTEVTIAAGQTTAFLTTSLFGSASAGLVEMQIPGYQPGYYRFKITQVRLNHPTQTASLGGGNTGWSYGLAVSAVTAYSPRTSSFSGGTNYYGYRPLYVITNPVNSVFQEAPFMFGRCRVTASAYLITNVTAEMVSGGDVMSAHAVAGHDMEGWWSLTRDLFSAAVGKQNWGYRGGLHDGAYGWMPLRENELDFKRYLETPARTSGPSTTAYEVGYVPVVDIGLKTFSATYWNSNPATVGPNLVATAPILSLQIRVDSHIEFASQSQVATLRITPLTMMDLEKASTILAAAPLFTENWIHLNELWGKIKSAASRMASAGGKALLSAIASQAMQELAGVAALAL